MKVLNKLKTPKKNQNKKIGKPFSRKVKDIKWIPVNLLDILLNFFDSVKSSFVYRSYWGRGSTYKQAVHVVIFMITIAVALSGISYRIFGLNASTQGLSTNYLGNAGNVDLLQQGSSIQTVITSNPNLPFKINYYKVGEGDSLDVVANKFGVTKDTIKFSNWDKFGNYDRYVSESLSPGEDLKIPQVSGILYEVKSDENLDSILSKTSGDRDQTIELNQLNGPSYNLNGRNWLLVANGSLPAPQPPPPLVIYNYAGSGQIYYGGTGGTPANGINLANPLVHPSCAGYVYQRGFSWYHDGVDLSLLSGCVVSSMAKGTVTLAGWPDDLSGMTVKINYGNGVTSTYYHLAEIYVKNGDTVDQGQSVGYMGNTGNSFGTHLHFILSIDGVKVDPNPYVPY